MGDDPTRRSPGAWPRDRPIRWRGVAGDLSWFLVSTACLLIQLGLVILVIVHGDAPWGPILALVWGIATLAAAWAWITWRRWIVIPPVLTALAIWLAAAAGG